MRIKQWWKTVTHPLWHQATSIWTLPKGGNRHRLWLGTSANERVHVFSRENLLHHFVPNTKFSCNRSYTRQEISKQFCICNAQFSVSGVRSQHSWSASLFRMILSIDVHEDNPSSHIALFTSSVLCLHCQLLDHKSNSFLHILRCAICHIFS